MKKLIATLAVVMIGLGAGIASADTSKYPTHFKKFKPEGTSAAVVGKLGSPKGKCVKKRKITVYKKGKKGKAASGMTNSKGKFEIPISGRVVGPYYAKAKKKNVGDDVCRGAKSKTVKL